MCPVIKFTINLSLIATIDYIKSKFQRQTGYGTEEFYWLFLEGTIDIVPLVGDRPRRLSSEARIDYAALESTADDDVIRKFKLELGKYESTPKIDIINVFMNLDNSDNFLFQNALYVAMMRSTDGPARSTRSHTGRIKLWVFCLHCPFIQHIYSAIFSP